MNYQSKIDKVVYNSSSNSYKIYFISNDLKFESFFNIPVYDAKNIVLAKEGIVSDRLKTYDLIVDLIVSLSIKIEKIIIFNRESEVTSNIYLHLNKNEYKFNLNYIDAIIIAMKTFSELYIHESLFSKTKLDKILNTKNKIPENKINNLKNILKLLIQNEEYESAALIRNKIKKINN